MSRNAHKLQFVYVNMCKVIQDKSSFLTISLPLQNFLFISKKLEFQLQGQFEQISCKASLLNKTKLWTRKAEHLTSIELINTSIFIVRWIDICAACFKFRCIEPMETLYRWVNHGREKKDIACPKIVTMYNDSMGGVDLTDMLIAVYRIQQNTMRWHNNVFLHIVDINAWILYKREKILHDVQKSH